MTQTRLDVGEADPEVAPAAVSFATRLRNYAITSHTPRADLPPIPETDPDRLVRAQHDDSDKPIDLDTYDPAARKDTILYLAYGSNLSAAKFQGDRAVRPLSAVNVHVPSLELTFDLPGVPYVEPCFANTAHRCPDAPSSDEKRPFLPRPHRRGHHDEHRAPWPRGLVGVVYEVTPTDYARIIATEGGGGTYQDIVVPCVPIGRDLPALPDTATIPAFRAHTLFAPRAEEGDGRRRRPFGLPRPDPDYAQPSARYLGLLVGGAKEHRLPRDYQAWLEGLEPYTATTARQRAGQVAFALVWVPFIMGVMKATGWFQDEDGRWPAWLVWLQAALFQGAWTSYDVVFKPVFGDGERTVSSGKKDGEANGSTKPPTIS